MGTSTISQCGTGLASDAAGILDIFNGLVIDNCTTGWSVAEAAKALGNGLASTISNCTTGINASSGGTADATNVVFTSNTTNFGITPNVLQINGAFIISNASGTLPANGQAQLYDSHLGSYQFCYQTSAPAVMAVATTAIGTYSGYPTINGYTYSGASPTLRVLLTAESPGKNNGIWNVASGAWTRPTDYDTGVTIIPGFNVWVSDACAAPYGDSTYYLTGSTNITVDTTATTWGQLGSTGNIGPAYVAPFGTGSDGNITISGNTTLSRDMYYANLTVNAGVILTTAGYRIFCSGLCTVNGTIDNSGGAGGAGSNGTVSAGGGAGTAGTATASNEVGSGAAGVVGTTGTTAGATNAGPGTAAAGMGGNGGAGGLSGKGNVGINGTGGAGGTTTVHNRNFISTDYFRLASGVYTLLQGGSSGGAAGGGGGDSTHGGGGGGGSGAGGGVLVLFANTINIGSAGVIQANGGAGGLGGSAYQSAGNSSGGGGGGGGGGGLVVLGYTSLTITAGGVITVAGGSGGGAGAKLGTGTAGGAGVNGSSGVKIEYNYTTNQYESH